jgi:hypothetical protein
MCASLGISCRLVPQLQATGEDRLAILKRHWSPAALHVDPREGWRKGKIATIPCTHGPQQTELLYVQADPCLLEELGHSHTITD